MTKNSPTPLSDPAHVPLHERPLYDNPLDESAMSAIRSMLADADAPKPARAAAASGKRPVAGERRKGDALPDLPQGEMRARAAEPVQTDAPRKTRRFSLRRKSAASPQDPVAKPSLLQGYRPKPAHLVLAGLALLIFMRPWLVFGLTLIFLFIMVGVFLIVGYDGFWQGVMKSGRWYARRRPARAAAVHARLDRLAVRWDAVLDRFPEGSVDALYLPDFGDMASAERRHDEAMERRLSGLQEKRA